MKRRLAALALLLVSAAFQMPATMMLHAADPLVSSFTFRDFFPVEDGLRWSGARSSIVLPDPGPGLSVRVEILLSGWRPPGVPSPSVTLSSGGRSITLHPGPGAQTVSLETVTSGLFRSDLEVEIRSDVFEPGAGDQRRLGVRVEEARLIPLSRGLVRPPGGALLTAIVGSLLIGFILGRAGLPLRRAEGVALVATVVFAALLAFARPFAAVWSGPAVLVLGVLGVASAVMPRAMRWTARFVGASADALVAGLIRLLDVYVLVAVVLAPLLVTIAYRARPRIEIDLGSGREAAVAKGFGPFLGKGGLRSRSAPRGAELDLSDFGGGSVWKIRMVAALDGAARDVAVLGAGDRELVIPLQENQWTDGALSATAPFGWRSGLTVTVPGGSDALRIERVTVDRGGALPSLRIVAAITLAALLVVVAFGAAGLSIRAGRVGSALLLLCCSASLAAEPLAAIPFASRFLAIVAMAGGLAVLIRGAVTILNDGRRTLPGPPAIGASVAGFAAWLTATAFPFYRGGHFVFHSSIAEEIWKGRFLIYYLPYPGSMLSEQAQWGKIVMPHPALYQTLVAPLAALPRPWFYLSEKIFLALLFASLVLVASVVAERVSGARAAAFTAILFVGLVPGFQLLGLGHLMTILGVWSSSVALGWLIFNVAALRQHKGWMAAVWLFAFCFLSYTAALLFTGAVLVFVIVVSARADAPRARSLFTMLCAASALAFILYYINWTLPFLSQSVPKIMGGAGLGGAAKEATPILSRLLLEPSRLSYSYGTMWIPLAGALSLWFLPRSWPRLVLLSWVGILFFVSGVDLFFNFLLKHHYYVMVPVAVGLGGLMARVESRWGRVPATLLTVLVLGLGLKTAIEVALGLIP